MLAILTAAGMGFGQGMQLEWDIPGGALFPRTVFPVNDNNSTLLDLENDGIIEIIVDINYSNPVCDSTKIYDGATHQLKCSLFFDSLNLGSNCFIDIDGDGKKELFAFGYNAIGSQYAFFIDVSNNTIKYEIPHYPGITHSCFIDIDKDNYPELLWNARDSLANPHFQVWGYHSTAVKPSPAGVYKAAAAKLFPSVPNPFRTSATIEYFIPSEGSVLLTIFNAEGKLVRTLVNEPKKKGAYSAIWDGTSDSGAPLSSGAYFYRLTLGSKIAVNRQMVFLK